MYTYIYIYIGMYVYQRKKNKPLNLWCLLWTPSNCCQFGNWNHSLSFSKHNNFAASAFWNRTCDMKIAPAKWRSQMRFWNRRCVCGLNFAGAIFASQVRNWHRSCGAQPGSRPTKDKYRFKRKDKKKSHEEIFYQMKVFFLLRSIVGSVFL